ncbi:MAG TPA: hypothetical protein VG796_01245 [Verrucomicrobiales bacterium]|nr:hypothetical protein [Verrucomicrobiales bacterium]
MKLGTDAAKTAYLFGEGDGRRVTNTRRLAEIGGVHESTIKRWLPTWKKEASELVRFSPECKLGISLNEGTLEQHRSDVVFLREQVDRLKRIVKSLPATDERYYVACRSLLATERQWAAMSGVIAALDAAAARLKDAERARGKAELDRKDSAGRKSPGFDTNHFLEIPT